MQVLTNLIVYSNFNNLFVSFVLKMQIKIIFDHSAKTEILYINVYTTRYSAILCALYVVGGSHYISKLKEDE